jgi:hypothetical protein
MSRDFRARMVNFVVENKASDGSSRGQNANTVYWP